ncbi:protein lethal(2)essential for life-like [Ostrinia furnacalis]|uniref:protein lethal(2)essential for life-like n=1 Tax=Ostrinia furnacalis TaxID=93504 RepID=UPI00103E4751|nr:protein lethal(2)essential for life-like [Ostrinia furnacalis]
MFLSPLYRVFRPNSNSWVQFRGVRPSIRIGREKFELTLNVKQFKKEELRVKARPEYVIIEGKQEKKSKKGYVIRQFVRKFKLPYGCTPETMKIHLSPDGILTVTAPRQTCDKNLPCETVIPISAAEPKVKTETLEAVQHIVEKTAEKPKDEKK